MLRKSLTWLILAAVLMFAAAGMAWADEAVSLDPGADLNPRPSPNPSPSPNPTPRPVLVTVVGVVQSVAADGFAMLSDSGQQLSILVTGDTRFIIIGDATPGLQDLAAGDRVVVVGWPLADDPNTITARIVTARKAQQQPIRVAGRVSAVDVPNSLFHMVVSELMRSHVAREIEVLVTSETEFIIPGVEEPGLDKLVVDDKVVVVSEPVAMSADVEGNRTELTEITAKTVYVLRVQPQPVTLLGKIAEMDHEEGTFDLVLDDGEVKHIATTDETKYRVPGVEDPTLEDVKDGDMAQVVAWPPSATEAPVLEERYTAVSVAVQKPRLVTLLGTIGEIDESAGTFELVSDSLTRLIETNSETRYKVPGIEAPTFADLETGQRALVTAWAVPIASATAAEQMYEFVAKLVVVIKPRQVNLNGIIEAVDPASSSFSLKLTSTGETKQVFTDERTAFTIPGLEDPVLSDLEDQIGSRAVVKAFSAADGAIWAQSVAVKPQAARRGSVLGEVTAIAGVEGGTALTVQTSAGEKHVLVTEETKIRPVGAEIEVGSRIAAAGLWMPDGSLKANTIAVRPAPVTPTPTPGVTA